VSGAAGQGCVVRGPRPMPAVAAACCTPQTSSTSNRQLCGACRDDGVGLAAPQVGVNVRLMVFNEAGEKGKGEEVRQGGDPGGGGGGGGQGLPLLAGSGAPPAQTRTPVAPACLTTSHRPAPADCAGQPPGHQRGEEHERV
jgi:hypothetical protein